MAGRRPYQMYERGSTGKLPITANATKYFAFETALAANYGTTEATVAETQTRRFQITGARVRQSLGALGGTAYTLMKNGVATDLVSGTITTGVTTTTFTGGPVDVRPGDTLSWRTVRGASIDTVTMNWIFATVKESLRGAK